MDNGGPKCIVCRDNNTMLPPDTNEHTASDTYLNKERIAAGRTDEGDADMNDAWTRFADRTVGLSESDFAVIRAELMQLFQQLF